MRNRLFYIALIKSAPARYEKRTSRHPTAISIPTLTFPRLDPPLGFKSLYKSCDWQSSFDSSMREAGSTDACLRAFTIGGNPLKDSIKEEALLVVGTDPGSETLTIGAALHYVEDRMKLDGVTHQVESKDKKNWRLGLMARPDG